MSGDLSLHDIVKLPKDFEDYTLAYDDTNSRLQNIPYGFVIKHLEQLLVQIVPDDKLPLLINNPWINKSSEEKYKERLKNAEVKNVG